MAEVGPEVPQPSEETSATAPDFTLQNADRRRAYTLLALARLRDRAGDHAGAGELYRQVAARGNAEALRDLAALRESEHRRPVDRRSGVGGRRRAFRGMAASVVTMVVLLGLGRAWSANSTKEDSDALLTAAASPAATMPSPTATPRCEDNVSGFLRAVKKVDPDGDELRGLDEAALVQLGHAALADPSVLRKTRLVPFQYPRFIGAANEWLCH